MSEQLVGAPGTVGIMHELSPEGERSLFAAAALIGLLAGRGAMDTITDVTLDKVWQVADGMLAAKQRGKR